MTSKVFDLKGKAVDKVKLPAVFRTPLRPDVVKRAVVALQSRRFQAQGRDPMAGKRTTAESRGVGLGIARVPRLKGGGGRAAFGVGIVGGHRAHPDSHCAPFAGGPVGSRNGGEVLGNPFY